MRNIFSTLVLIFFLIIGTYRLCAQKDNEKKFGISFSGFVKNDAFYDTRQSTTIREGHFLLYPSNVNKDVEGKDINDHPSFNILSIQSRLTGVISGPDAFGAKTSGALEGAFFGHSDPDINGFRLRHAFVKLNWEKSELISGQYWHPLFIVQAFPEVISFNTGVPFQPFSRNPQMRYTRKFKNISAIATLYTQRDFTSTGPIGASSIYMRNAVIPGKNITLTYSPKESKNIFGVGVDHKSLMPETSTSLGHKTNTTINSISATAFTKIILGKLTFKLQGLYAQNAYDIVGIGGYAVKENSFDTITGKRDFTNLQTGSVWTEIYYKKNGFTTGVFAGYTKNLGSVEKMNTQADNIFARGSNIYEVYRVSPRLAFTQNNTTIAFEVEYTNATYGKTNNKGLIENRNSVSNIRTLLSIIYKF